VGRSTEKAEDMKMDEVQKRSNWCVPTKLSGRACKFGLHLPEGTVQNRAEPKGQ